MPGRASWLAFPGFGHHIRLPEMGLFFLYLSSTPHSILTSPTRSPGGRCTRGNQNNAMNTVGA